MKPEQQTAVAYELDMAIAQRREPVAVIVARVLGVADPDARRVEQTDDDGEHLFPRQSGQREIAAQVPWFKFATTVSRPWEDTAWTGETGRVDDLIRKYADVWSLRPAETTGYLCGHPSMVENGRGILQRAGWKKDALFEEIYFQPAKEVEEEA